MLHEMSHGQSQQQGGFFSAIGDFFGFDGEFGYQGPEGRSLSVGGLGDSFRVAFGDVDLTVATSTMQPMSADLGRVSDLVDMLAPVRLDFAVPRSAGARPNGASAQRPTDGYWEEYGPDGTVVREYGSSDYKYGFPSGSGLQLRSFHGTAVREAPPLFSGYLGDAMGEAGAVAVPNQQYGGQRSYQLHHRDPIQHGGAVYDMSNILIVTPRYHQEVLDPSYHYGRPRNR